MKHDKPKQHKISVDPTSKQVSKTVSDVDELSDSQEMRLTSSEPAAEKNVCYAQRVSVSHLLIRTLQTAQSPCSQFRPDWFV